MILDQLTNSKMEFVAVYRNDRAETVILFSLVTKAARDASPSRFAALQKSVFGSDLLKASVGQSISRTITIPQ